MTLGRAPGDTFITVADEPNDDPADATLWDVVDVLTNYTAGGILDPTGDADYIRVPVEEGQALRVYGFPNSGSLGTAQVTVLLPDGVTEIATYEGLGWATDQRALVPVLETDDYYLRVREADGRGGFDYWYYLHAAKNDAADGAPAESEPNDLAEDADDITELDALWARIHPAGDVDQYVFEATGDERLTLRAVRTEHGETTALDLALLDPDGNDVASDTGNGGEDDSLVELLELVEGTYTLRVAEQNPDAGDQANRFYALEIITQ